MLVRDRVRTSIIGDRYVLKGLRVIESGVTEGEALLPVPGERRVPGQVA
jgi:hypothetical protein